VATSDSVTSETAGRILTRGRPAARALFRQVHGLRESASQLPRRIVAAWRRSILFRVVATTLLLSIAVVALLGQLVLARVRDGLLTAKVESSLAQANSGFRSAQARLDTAAQTDPANIGQLLTELVTELKSQAGTANAYEIIVLPSSGYQAVTTGRGSRATGRIRLESVPSDLRAAVTQDISAVSYRYVPLRYDDRGDTVPGVAFGRQVLVPTAGYYELYFLFPLTQEQRTMGLVFGRLATVGTLLVLLLAAIAYVVTRSVVTPVRMAARVAERIAAGRLAERMTERGEDDLARLAVSFNKMASTLQRQIRQLEDLSRVQRQFVSDVSHELRTPLTTIRMAADVIHEARSSMDPHLARSAELLHTQLDRFESLLTDLLEISRFDAGAAVLEAESTDLRDICRQVIDSVEPVAEQCGSRIRLAAPATPCTAEVDPRRIERILRNLLLNALEYGEGRDVTVRVALAPDAVAVAVRDHGVGLRPGESSLVFNRFWRADPARTRPGGTGLGLSIAMEDAHLHGGWLQAWGRPGEGAQFRLTLPRVAGAEIERAPISLEPEDSRRRRGLPPGRGRAASAAVPAVPVAASVPAVVPAPDALGGTVPVDRGDLTNRADLTKRPAGDGAGPG
jgi:two-component system, OmpR family, sensor histidine kinase MtrB